MNAPHRGLTSRKLVLPSLLLSLLALHCGPVQDQDGDSLGLGGAGPSGGRSGADSGGSGTVGGAPHAGGHGHTGGARPAGGSAHAGGAVHSGGTDGAGDAHFVGGSESVGGAECVGGMNPSGGSPAGGDSSAGGYSYGAGYSYGGYTYGGGDSGGGANAGGALSGGAANAGGSSSGGTAGSGGGSSEGPIDWELSPEVRRLSGSSWHSCALRPGGVYCWGQNNYGMVGSGQEDELILTPTRVPGLDSAVNLSSGGYCAVLSDGTPKCWGTRVDLNGPVFGTAALALLPPIKVFGPGGDHACAISQAGEVYCWGENGSGQLGDGTTVDQPSPQVVPGLTGALALRMYVGGNCALLESGEVKCWGKNAYGQLGRPSGGASDADLSPVVVSLPGPARSLAGNCVALTSGEVHCWGSGQVGGRSHSASGYPEVVSGLSDVAAVFDVGDRVYAVHDDGTLSGWGENQWGGLGDGTQGVDRAVPVPIVAQENIIDVTAGDNFFCTLDEDGAVSCNGWESWGQFGDGQRRNVRAARVPGMEDVVSISSNCATKSDGTTYCWGSGIGVNGENSTIPRLIPDLTGAVQVEGRYGRMPDGTVIQANVTPGSAVTKSGLTDVIDLSVRAHGCAVKSNGEIWCWGLNTSGQLGDGTIDATSIWHNDPVQVVGLPSAERVWTGEGKTCARLTTGTITCWGAGWNGKVDMGAAYAGAIDVELGPMGQEFQLPDQSWLPVTSPAPRVDYGYGHDFMCHVAPYGRLTCRGKNFYGQLGSPPEVDGFDHVNIVAGLEFPLDIKLGDYHGCALMPDHTVMCWGNNMYGDTAYRPEPIVFQ